MPKVSYVADEKREAFLIHLMEETGIKTKQDLIDNAVISFGWAVAEKKAGRAVVSADKEGRLIKELVVPALEGVQEDENIEKQEEKVGAKATVLSMGAYVDKHGELVSEIAVPIKVDDTLIGMVNLNRVEEKSGLQKEDEESLRREIEEKFKQVDRQFEEVFELIKTVYLGDTADANRTQDALKHFSLMAANFRKKQMESRTYNRFTDIRNRKASQPLPKDKVKQTNDSADYPQESDQ